MKRGIAGTLIFIMFDQHAILSQLGALAKEKSLKFQADKSEIKPVGRAGGKDITSSLTLAGSSSTAFAADTNINQQVNQALQLTSVGSDQEIALPWYADQIPPFDITLAAANEYGALAAMSIIGAELLNEGYGVSIDDMVSEMQHTYVARAIDPWQGIPNDDKIKEIINSGAST